MSEHEKATPRPWRARWEDVEQQYNRFCEAERAKGTLWQDIPNCTQWFLDSYDASRVLIEQMRDALKSLRNEAHGFLSMADPNRHGYTNCRVLLNRLDEADAQIAAAEKFLEEE